MVFFLYFSVAGFSEASNIVTLCPDKIEEIEKLASGVPLHILREAKLLKISREKVNEILHFILGPSYQEVRVGAPFQFSKGEKTLISRIIEFIKNGVNSCFIEYDMSNVLTPTFFGNLFKNNLYITSNQPFLQLPTSQKADPITRTKIGLEEEFLKVNY